MSLANETATYHGLNAASSHLAVEFSQVDAESGTPSFSENLSQTVPIQTPGKNLVVQEHQFLLLTTAKFVPDARVFAKSVSVAGLLTESVLN
jgi:hypothetical protein